MRWTRIAVPVAAVTVLLGACGSAGQGVAESSSTSTSVDSGIPRGEVPDAIFTAVVDDLAGVLGVAVDDYTIIRDEEALWADGSLGCARPGLEYTMAPVQGYWIVLVVDGIEYDYRSDRNGNVVLCEDAASGQAPAG